MAPESFPEPTSLYPAVHQATCPTGRRDDTVEKLCWQDHYHLIAMGIDSKAKKGCTSGMTKVLNLVTKGTMALLREVMERVSVISHVILMYPIHNKGKTVNHTKGVCGEGEKGRTSE